MGRIGNIFKNKSALLKTTLLFLIILIIVFSITFSVLLFIENTFIESERDELINHELTLVELESDLLAKEFDSIISDIMFLTENYKDRIIQDADIEQVANEWKSFSDNMKSFDQIRFIDINGNEVIRVNYSDNGSYIVEESQLQNKKDRYYFYESANLKEGQLYISKIDLNIENGMIEQPIKPMIRFCMPIFDDYSQMKGVIVLNYLADRIIENFDNIATHSSAQMSLLNSDSFWISGSDKSLEWAFMYDDKTELTFKNTFPAEWEKISESIGFILTENGLFTYTDVILKDKLQNNKALIEENNLVLGDGNWKIVSYLDTESESGYILTANILSKINKIFNNNVPIFILLVVISVILSVLISLSRQTSERIKVYSEFDALTNTYNRRAGFNLLKKSMPPENKRKNNTTINYIDIDGLKQVNDSMGHRIGDELIVTIVETISRHLRKTDFIIRLGGDEFLIVFNQANLAEAEAVWKRILAAFDKINEKENRPYLISISHGMVEPDSCTEKNIEEIIKLADTRMYMEKRKLKKGLKYVKENTDDK